MAMLRERLTLVVNMEEPGSQLSQAQRRQILIDALSEFLDERRSYPALETMLTDDHERLVNARLYVAERYSTMSQDWRDRKALEVVERCKYAAALLRAVREMS